MILNIQQLSVEINLAIKTIRTTLVRNPKALPPRLIIDGQKKLLWLWTDVQEFYQQQKRVHGSNPAFSTAVCIKPPELQQQVREPKRGRPTKAEQMAKSAKSKGL